MPIRLLESRLASLLCTSLLTLALGGPAAAAQPGETFRRLDRDGDGRLSADEVQREALFRQIDADADGYVTSEEARQYFARRQPPQNAHARSIPLGEDVIVRRDIRYAETCGVDAVSQSLDLYTPKDATKAPVMVYVHGGGWQKGDKAAVGSKAAFFTGQGFLFVSLNYRLLPAGRHPANVEDVASALAWVHTNVADYGGEPDKLLLMGHSAGAHLVALVATDERRLKAAGKELSILKGVIPLDTQAYDIGGVMEQTQGASLYRQVFGDDPAVWRDASPLAHVAAGKDIPPFLIFHTASPEGRSRQAMAFAEALHNVGVSAKVVPVPSESHGELNQSLGRPDDPETDQAMKFIEACLKGKEQA